MPFLENISQRPSKGTCHSCYVMGLTLILFHKRPREYYNNYDIQSFMDIKEVYHLDPLD